MMGEKRWEMGDGRWEMGAKNERWKAPYWVLWPIQ